MPGGRGGIAGCDTGAAGATAGGGGAAGTLVGGTAVGTVIGAAVEAAVGTSVIVGTTVGDDASVGVTVGNGASVGVVGVLASGTAVGAGASVGARVGARDTAGVAGAPTIAGALAGGRFALEVRPNDCRARKPMASNATMIAAMPNQARRETPFMPRMRPCTGAGTSIPGGGGMRGGVMRVAVAGSTVSGYSCRTTISSGGAVVLTGWFAASITFTDPGDVSLRVGVIRSATRSADPVKV